jgi:hypothetical protein
MATGLFSHPLSVTSSDSDSLRSDEAAVPDDEQINDLMATNDTEFALYQRLDKEREARRRALYEATAYPMSVASVAAASAAAQRSAKAAAAGEGGPDGEKKETVVPLPPRLMSVAEVPSWTKTQEAWLSKHHQLLAMSEQVDKNNMQVGDGGVYGAAEADGDEEEDSNIDALSVEGASGGRGLGGSAGAWSTNTRKRKSVAGAYDDGLTETQFMELVEKTEKVHSFCLCPSALSFLLLLSPPFRRLRTKRLPLLAKELPVVARKSSPQSPWQVCSRRRPLPCQTLAMTPTPSLLS